MSGDNGAASVLGEPDTDGFTILGVVTALVKIAAGEWLISLVAASGSMPRWIDNGAASAYGDREADGFTRTDVTAPVETGAGDSLPPVAA